MFADPRRGFNPTPPVGSHGTLQYYTKSQFYESSEVDENSVVGINSVKLVDKSSVLVENTGLKLEELDKKAVVYQSVFSQNSEEK